MLCSRLLLCWVALLESEVCCRQLVPYLVRQLHGQVVTHHQKQGTNGTLLAQSSSLRHLTKALIPKLTLRAVLHRLVTWEATNFDA